MVVTGSSKKTYEQIYHTVKEVAKKAGIGRVTAVSDYISCQYSDPYALRIKKHYNIIWKWIRENSDIDDHFLISKKLDKKLWEPQKILSGSKDFKLLVFRRNGQPWKRRQ